ncbi:dihydrofolate reductase [Ramlibacter sp. AW1]|uniref:Dihydrofolate reductase n=1 Tax=Ramlibacter aurantiacus TaxID=2801330 RepID=A0A937D116_9BURK|nr:dihydrofolate reductase [Ramlibacter aurantiacus]MBL0420049.1 dihydrofolate reductase [Ramlibacter aurantiacus]
MQLGLIYARARNGVIGVGGALPWHLPADLAHFKAITHGQPVIMGRKTWDSLPPRFRPLPGRRNIVVTRQPDWSATGAERASSLEQAVTLCEGSARAWVIGGAELYALALPHAQLAEVTEIDADFEGDAHAPTLGPPWAEQSRETHASDEGLRYAFVRYVRTGS